MVAITLPDGKSLSFDGPVTPADVAAKIGPGLAKAALAAKVDGKLWDLTRPVTADAKMSIVTARDPEGVEVMRHDAAHVMAQAVQELYPGTQITFGPSTDDGFYYDFVRDEPFTPDDFAKIEAKMREIVGRDLAIIREEWSPEQAVSYFQKAGETYKAEWVSEIAKRGEPISIYRQGDWLDLCMGPHLPSTGKLPTSFKVMKVAGAYWRGDAKNKMLQRIYGTVWPDDKQLKAHLTMIEEAEKRDHRRLGREMDLFHIQEEAVGSVFWHPNGWTLYRAVEDYMRARLKTHGYVEVKTPQLVSRSLWEASGHWEKFGKNMFMATTGEEDVHVAIKPMNCPCHVQIFRQGLKSYRDLPLRMAEFGACHRYEPSGALHGIMRVRAFTQDDAHIFCTEDQITAETVAFCDMLKAVYKDFGFVDVRVKFSDRPATRAGEDAIWDKAEGALLAASKEAGLETMLNPGEGAFYGPKLEFVLRDAIGRDWQCGTLQVDFVLPERLDASYVAEDGTKKRPVMLHRAIFGSFERFIGILIEQYAGKFPLWLAPQQVVVTTITNDADDYAREVVARLAAQGLRVSADLRAEKIGYKVREHSLAKVPVIIAVGKREADERKVAIRRLGSTDQEILALDEAAARLAAEAQAPSL